MSHRELLVLLVVMSLCAHAHCQQMDRAQVFLLPTEESALICEAGGVLGGGAEGEAGKSNPAPTDLPNRRQVLIELVTRVDVNRDLQLDHRELQTLDKSERQRLLQDVDTNLDRKLSAQELQQALATVEAAPLGYPYPEEPLEQAPAQPETFRNLRRFGLGVQQAGPQPRSQPFVRAAVFGTSPGFRPPPQKGPLGPRAGGGSCRLSVGSQATVSLRAR